MTCFDDKNCPNLSSFNFKKVIYSTGFYSPPVIENEVYTYSQLFMESFAAENRGFRCTKRPKKHKIQPYFDEFGQRWLSNSPNRHGRLANKTNRFDKNIYNLKHAKNYVKIIKKTFAFSEAVEVASRPRRKKINEILQCAV